MYKLYSLLALIIFSFSSPILADSLTLTCDFTYYRNDGVYNSVPKGCTNDLKSYLLDEYGEAGTFSDLPSSLESDEFLLANPPKCPSGYKSFGINQASMIANSGHVFSYQIRNICLEKLINKN